MQTNIRHKRWYAIQPFYRRYAEIHHVLDSLNVGYIHPYRFNAVKKDGRQQGEGHPGGVYDMELEPVMVVQLIFFYADIFELEEIRKQTYDYGRVLPRLGTRLWEPLAVPGDQLLEFLKVLSIDADYELVDDRPEAFAKGEAVRVIAGGQYDGLEGVICRIKKNRHLIVRVEGVCAIATGYIPQAHLAKKGVSSFGQRTMMLPCMKVAELAYNLRLVAALGRENKFDNALCGEVYGLMRTTRELMADIGHLDTRLDLQLGWVERLMAEFRPEGDRKNETEELPEECLRTRELCDEIRRHFCMNTQK